MAERTEHPVRTKLTYSVAMPTIKTTSKSANHFLSVASVWHKAESRRRPVRIKLTVIDLARQVCYTLHHGEAPKDLPVYSATVHRKWTIFKL